MPRIVFLNRFFYPDHSATSQILSDLAFDLAAAGRDVHVVTSRQRYDDAAAELPEHERVRGVRVRRVATTRFGRLSLVGRGLDYISYGRAMARAIDGLAGPGDLLVAMTDPPLLSVVAARAAKRSGARLINWLQDLYPDAAVALKLPFMRGPVPAALAALRNTSLQSAVTNVVVSEAMAQRVAAAGIAPDKINLIPNWTDDESIVPLPAADNSLRRAWALDGKFVVGYSGNFGRAHDFEAILAAAERLRDHPRIAFVFTGGGQQSDLLARRIGERRLAGTVRLFPYQDRAALPVSLSVPDVHWLSLRPELEGIIFPSKFYGIAAAGRPIVALAATNGEIAGLLERYRCGFAVEPSGVTRLTGLLVALANDAPRCSELGRQARKMLDANFTRRHAFALWRAVLERHA
jgi:colanic acid biosynthesis glycosyl transferase WcaI